MKKERPTSNKEHRRKNGKEYRIVNRGIFNIEVFDCCCGGSLPRTSLKNKRAYFSVPPGGTQVLAKGNHVPTRKRCTLLSRIYLSLERDRFQLAANQREGRLGIGLLFLLLIFLIPTTIQAQNNIKTDFRGYVKELGSISLSNDLGSIRYDNILHHRIESRFSFGKNFEFRGDVRNRLFNGWTVKNAPGYGDFLEKDLGYFDLSHTWIDSDHTVLNSAIDRLHLSYINGPWEVHAGRQRINWGKTMVWNPNDLFNAYAYLDFDYEERPGTDALYALYSWSYASSIEAGYRFGDTFDESVVAAMYRGNLGEYDIQLIGGNYFDQLALGAGWSGYLKNAGFKGETTYFHPRKNFFNESGHVTASLGGDYMFSNGVYLSTEFLYNGGWKRAVNPVGELMQPPSADDLFIAKTGYFVNASYSINPLTSISGGILGSFDRKMLILIPQISRSLGDNLDFLILAQLLKGEVFANITETPNVLYFRLKWSY